jgi:RHH-type transcriptional regulator, rel operon repressor / antitoxin RelB
MANSSLPKTLNVRLSDALYTQLEALASATARTKSFLAVEALTRYLESQAWHVQDIQDGIAEADRGEFASSEEVSAVFAKYTSR